MNKIRDRLLHEKKSNISLNVEEMAGREDAIRVAGRGELHLSILIEAMRREGYEFLVSKPRVILKENKDVICKTLMHSVYFLVTECNYLNVYKI